MSEKFITGAVVGFAAAYLLLNQKGSAAPVSTGSGTAYYPNTPGTKKTPRQSPGSSADKWTSGAVVRGFFPRKPRGIILPAYYAP